MTFPHPTLTLGATIKKSEKQHRSIALAELNFSPPEPCTAAESSCAFQAGGTLQTVSPGANLVALINIPFQ